jgi:RND superfamily putative drug exporter
VPSSSAGADALTLVRDIRALRVENLTGVAGARVLTTGLAAFALDYQEFLRRALPWIVAATAGATVLALLIAFRAPLAALKAVTLNLLVSAAAIGATVLVFQDGFGAALLGHRTLGSIFPTVPVLAFAATFGMSMNYELFLLTSVRQRRLAGASEPDAIVEGLATTGALVTRAAAIMICLFVAFATSDLLPLAMVGFALAVAVTLDATVVRLALAPALLVIAGRWNWWPRR